jgi:transcriptional regulator with XRE-family HTH domain
MASPYERFLSDLRAIRLAKGFTQSAIAKRLKLSRAQYTAIENGRSTMSFVHLYNLSVILDVQWTIGRKRA